MRKKYSMLDVYYPLLIGETFYQFALKCWAAKDKQIIEENKENSKIFKKVLNTYIVLNNKKMIIITREIIKELEDDRANGVKAVDRNIRFVVRKAEKDRGRAGDEFKKPSNAKQKDVGPEQRKNVHYRWKDKPGKNNASSSNSHGLS